MLMSDVDRPDYVTLSNQKRVRIRTLQNGEDAPIRELWPHLSPRTRYLRFLTVLTTLPDSLLRCLVSTANCKQQAIVAEHEADGEAIVVGLVNLGQLDDGSVEVGLVVRDDWQRQRLGTALALRMIQTAERRGFRRFVGHVLHENVAMHKILRNVGEIVSRRIDGRVQELAFVRRPR
jgi:GNAT superfamily N-acetyltransferase